MKDNYDFKKSGKNPYAKKLKQQSAELPKKMNDSDYLLSIKGMRVSIQEGLKTPVENCSEERQSCSGKDKI